MADYRYIEEKELWNEEFDRVQIIPSSTRMAPSKALVLFSELLGFGPGTRVLEPGCGTGRNSIYLAQRGCEVHAIDFSEVALERLSQEVRRAQLTERIHVYKRPLEERFPFESSYFDSVVDSYVLCHFLAETMKVQYLDEISRVLKPGGKFFCSVFSDKDEYYRALVQIEGQRVALDPVNRIRKQLYTEHEITALLTKRFEVPYFVNFKFVDHVRERPYQRDLYVLVGQKI